MTEPLRRLYGYSRVSTEDQDLTLQRSALERYGVDPEWIYEEHGSGGTMDRKVLSRLLRSIREEDTLVVWKLDRLGRTLKGVLQVLEEIERDGIHFVSLTESFDTSTPIGKAMLHICLVFAELERNMISERTKAGMMEAKKRGKKFGRRHMILTVPKRINWLRRQHKAGKLLDADGDLTMTAEQIRVKLNKLAPDALPIQNEATILRWKNGAGSFPPLAGLDVEDVDDEPLDTERRSV
jgi:DNA invertase Pin-like site-specific DNA recombinase